MPMQPVGPRPPFGPPAIPPTSGSVITYRFKGDGTCSRLGAVAWPPRAEGCSDFCVKSKDGQTSLQVFVWEAQGKIWKMIFHAN